MTARTLAKDRLDMCRRYLGIARQVGNPEIQGAYEGLARQAFRQAAKLDPAAVTSWWHASQELAEIATNRGVENL
jgi:hypothetical protein